MNLISNMCLGADELYAKLQHFAFDSWEPQFDMIVLGNEPTPEFEAERFLSLPNPPRIKDLVAEAATLPGITVLINGDCYLAKNCAGKLQALKATCGWTCRHNYDPKTMDLEKAEFNPGGHDMFFATQAVWSKCADEIPKCFHLGHWCWDQWMMVFLGCQPGFYDFTHLRLMFHPLLPPLYSSKGGREAIRKEIDEWITKR